MPAICFLLFATVAFRLATFGQTAFANAAPLAAIALCSGLFLPRFRRAGVAALGGLILSDLIINGKASLMDPNTDFSALTFNLGIICRYFIYGGLFVLAWRLRERRGPGLALALTPLGSVFAYVAMNSVFWATAVAPFAYEKTLSGWIQCQTVGVPGFPPSYLFLRNAMIGDLLFTGSFLALVVWLPKWLHGCRKGPAETNAVIPS